ncbi:MAG TPA: KAP family P-loop domain-containing protein [Cyanobacteria bacterium UBA8803]|nr:KAP family P-loop domain-containing protein [Cyanobacteria bacterium UBA9273]HBL59997.1 KAP family P-loop domain-containing protein [Cyanobacteria bacterium UBA8803]
MTLDFQRFFKASNPSKTLDLAKPEDRQYYIDFSPVRGGKIIQELKRTITRLAPDDPTCQLFTGHIGCGKSTELLRLKNELEVEGFHVVYFESSQDLDMADVDISDILLAIAQRVSKSLEEIKINVQATGFRNLLQTVGRVLNAEVKSFKLKVPQVGDVGASTNEEGEFSLAFGIGEITAKAKDSREVRSLLRQYLEPQVNGILEALNKELIEVAIKQLKQLGKKGLVVIVDNLDRVDNIQKPSGRSQPEYLFVDRGEQLNKLKCHVVYTIPLVLAFSNDLGGLTNRFGIDPKILPMVRVKSKDGTRCEDGIALLRQMVMARAFPDLNPQQRLNSISEVFDTPNTLDRLCLVSGGHVRNLLVLLYRCLQKDDPPISYQCLESVISQRRNELSLAITPDEWELLQQVARQKTVRGEDGYQAMLRSLFVFEYRDPDECWFDINPVLAEAKELHS